MYHLQKLLLVFIVAITVASCSSNSKSANKTGAETAIAAANGIDEFPKVKTLEFTFNVDKDSAHFERHWKWMPEDNMVVSYNKMDSVQFKRMDTSTADLKKLNADFTNDEYWLVYPLHLQWDNGYTFNNNDTATGPVTGKSLHKYTIQYNNKDGFTPGDMYEIYVDGNNMIQEWAYHKTGSKEPTLMTSWEDYGDYNGLKIAKDHKSKDGSFRLYFTGVAVTH